GAAATSTGAPAWIFWARRKARPTCAPRAPPIAKACGRPCARMPTSRPNPRRTRFPRLRCWPMWRRRRVPWPWCRWKTPPAWSTSPICRAPTAAIPTGASASRWPPPIAWTRPPRANGWRRYGPCEGASH
ncbi:LOW QUALITY PROTEIN: 4-alpha-glucanotransferase, partial [Achromobacter xylosoxidans C54]